MEKLTILIIAMSSIFGMTKINAQVVVGASIGVAPPELLVYAQPPCNNDGYLWSPGYWAYGSDGYYWVPVFGWIHLRQVFSGLPVIGVLLTGGTVGILVIGVLQ